MNDNNQPLVEHLLSQMSLESPSQQLDEAVLKLTVQQVDGIVPARSGRYGWRSLAMTAIVCTAAGVLIGSWYSDRPTRRVPGAVPAGDAPAVATSLRESEKIPLHGPAARVIDDGFVLMDGVQPSRLYRIVKSRHRQRGLGLPIRQRIVLPSPEI